MCSCRRAVFPPAAHVASLLLALLSGSFFGTPESFAQPGVSITQSGGSTQVSEAGPTSDIYTIVLNTPPAAQVDIILTPDLQTTLGAGAGIGILVSFNVTNWNVPQSITVTAVDDPVVEGPHTSTITHVAGSTDPDYDGIAIANVVASVNDNDVADVLLTESDGSTHIAESGPTVDSYTLALTSKPSHTVTITVDPDDQSDVGTGPGVSTTVVISPATWNIPRTVIVTAVDDAVPEGPHTSTITHTVTSLDPNYEGLVLAGVIAHITDNDMAGVTILESAGSTDVTETGPTTDSYTISLDREPTNTVTITVTPDAETNLGAGAGMPINVVFPVATWNVSRTVNVTAVDDAVPEGPHTSTITHSVSSLDPDYNGIAVANVVANVADNDLFGVSIVESDGATTVSELGATSDTYTVVLQSQPAANVIITVDPDSQTNVGAGPGAAVNLTFSSGDWATPQTVTVTAVDDAVDEASPHTSTITHTAVSADGNYDGLAIADVVVSVTDNDTAGVSITESAGSTAVSETGPTSDTYTIELDSEPTAVVTITVDPDSQTNLGAGAGAAIELTFTSGNWATPQTVTATAVDDDVDEASPHTSTITHTAASADGNYDSFAIGNVVANVTDNDTAGVTMAESGGSTAVSETGPTSDTYTIVLQSQPTAVVTITVDPDVQTNLGAGVGVAIELTFTSGNWDTPQTVTVTAVDDLDQEGPHTSTITHAAASADGNYDGIGIGDVVASVADNDIPGVTITESAGSTSVSETGPTNDTYIIVLLSLPTANVTITVDPDAQTNLGTGAGVAVELTFTTGNWSTPQTITVTAVNDDVDETSPHTSTITHTAASTDGSYDGIAIGNVVANVIDNDTAEVTLIESDGSTAVSETGPTSDTYTLVLQSQPTADVTITVDPDVQTNLGAGAGVAIELTFASGDWDIPQTVTVTAVDDLDEEGPHTSTITHTAASADGNYDGIAMGDVVANVADNDVPGVTITESAGSTAVSEGGPTNDTYTIVLLSLPTANVTITIDPDAQTNLGAGAGVAVELTFTTGNWATPQTVTVTAVDDDVDETSPHTSTITHTAASADGNYQGIGIVNVVANVTDNDTAGVTIAESGGSTAVSETGPTSDTYTIVLQSQPTGEVTITIDPDVQTNLGAGAGVAINLIFTSGNWDTPQTITVTAVDDYVDETLPHTSTITHTAASADGNYQGIGIANVVANITDNDTAGVTLTESGGSTDVSEAGPGSDTYTIVLQSQPTANVTITIDPDVQTNLGAGAGVAINRTFTSADWNTPQTITVTAVDDYVDETSPHTSTITHTAASADGNYQDIAIGDVVASVTDNDTAGVTIAESGGATAVSETGPTSDSYTIVLQSQPTANVTITIDPDVQTNLGAGAGIAITRTFTSANWNTPQTITVTAVDDYVDETSPHTSTIIHTAASGDGNYQGIGIANVVANITDNDTAGVTLTESGGSTDVSEAGPGSDTYTIVLQSQPTANVTITVDPDNQTNLGAGAGVAINLIFTSGNWDTPQTITVTAVDDYIDETSPHTSTITHAATSADGNYQGIAIGNVVASVTDNDTAGVTITESGGSTDVSEAGPTSDSYTVVLQTQPAANVTITVDPDIQTNLGAGAGVAIELTFTSGDWNTPQTVTVTAVDDPVDEGSPHLSTITHTVASVDGNYDGLGIGNVVANITDNDSAGVTTTESVGSTVVSENGPTSDTYTIVLNSAPTADVSITVDPDDQTSVGAGKGVAITLTFTGANWNSAQAVTVTAIDDGLLEGNHHSSIAHLVNSADLNYHRIPAVDVVADVLDNDLVGVTIAEPGGSTNVSEAGPTSDTYTIVLQSRPTADVAITVDPDIQTNLGAGAGVAINVTFTPANWNTPQLVGVTAVDDHLDEESPHTAVITHAATSADAGYHGLSIRSVTVNITDNDTAGVRIAETDGATIVRWNEPRSDSYSLVLDTRPSANVIVRITIRTPVDADAGVQTPIERTFTPQNWSTPQAVTVTLLDGLSGPGLQALTILHAARSADPNYDRLEIRPVTVHVVLPPGGTTEDPLPPVEVVLPLMPALPFPVCGIPLPFPTLAVFLGFGGMRLGYQRQRRRRRVSRGPAGSFGKPGDHTKSLPPLVSCRECGQEYYVSFRQACVVVNRTAAVQSVVL